MKPPACTHNGQFEARLQVDRAVSGKTIGFRAQISIRCSTCGKPFLFNGMSTVNPVSTMLSAPATTSDRKTVVAPIEPGA